MKSGDFPVIGGLFWKYNILKLKKFLYRIFFSSTVWCQKSFHTAAQFVSCSCYILLVITLIYSHCIFCLKLTSTVASFRLGCSYLKILLLSLDMEGKTIFRQSHHGYGMLLKWALMILCLLVLKSLLRLQKKA